MIGPETSPYDPYLGLDDEYWLTKDGLYPQAIMAMICRLTSSEDDNDCPVNAASIIMQSGLTLLLALLSLEI